MEAVNLTRYMSGGAYTSKKNSQQRCSGPTSEALGPEERNRRIGAARADCDVRIQALLRLSTADDTEVDSGRVRMGDEDSPAILLGSFEPSAEE